MKSLFLKTRLPLLLLLTLFDGLIIWHHLDDNRFLLEFSQASVNVDAVPSETAIDLLNHIQEEVRQDRYDGGFLLPLFSPLRPTARQVVVHGGDCADRSRLLISMLHLYGIKASKVALYDEHEIPRHAVVDVEIENGQHMAIDALLGIYFPREDGGFYSVWDVKREEDILRKRIAKLAGQGRPELAKYPFERYTYKYARTINWEKSASSRLLYTILKTVLGDDVNHLGRPYFVESPALMVLYATLLLQFLLLLTYMPIVDIWLHRSHSSKFNG